MKEDLRRTAEGFGSTTFELREVTRRAHRRDTRRRLAAGVTAVVVVAVSGSFLVRAFDDGPGVAGTGLLGVENGPISFTIAENDRVVDTSRIGIVGGAGSQVDVVEGFPDYETGGWSPDGSRLVFSRWDGSSQYDPDIWVIDRDGTDLQRLTYGPAGDFSAQFSPSGHQILFMREGDGTWTSPTPMLMDVDGRHLRRLSDGDEYTFGARWSPDGQHILTGGYPQEEGGLNWLVVMDADGSNRRVLFRGHYNEPSWSGDGSRILISSEGRLLIIPLDGGEPMEAVEGVDRQGLSQAEWSPDGANLLYTQPIDPKSGEELWVAPVSGDGARLVAEGLQWRDPAPAWAPDGSAIAFVRDGDIWTVDIDTGVQVQITDTSEYESNPAWGVVQASP